MMRDIRWDILLTVGICFFMVGCATSRVSYELVDYVNQGILRIAELEKKSLERYASVTGENYTTDQKVHDSLKDYVIPVYKQFLDGLRDIKPKEEEIRRLHGIYVRGADSLYKGFREKLLGLEMKNENLIRLANEKIERGRVENERWRKELTALSKKHSIAEKKDKDR